MSESCPLGWCERAAGHPVPHRGTIVAAPGERTATLVVAVESFAADGAGAMPVVLVRDGDAFAHVHLEWGRLHTLATASIAAYRTFTREPAYRQPQRAR